MDIAEGTEIIVIHCENRSGSQVFPYFVSSDKKLFPNIRKSISHYIEVKRNPATLLEVPEIVKNSDDMLFLGYIVNLLSKGGAINSGYTPLILSKILETDKIPDNNPGFTRIMLINSLSESNFYLTNPDTIAETFGTLVEVAGSSKKMAKHALLVLAFIAKHGKVDIRPYMNFEQRNLLLENIQKLLVVGQQGREELIRMLLSK